MTDERGPVCITGGSGFVGRHLARRLVRDGRLVRVLHRATSRPPPAAGVELLAVDYRREADLERAFEGAAAVVHLIGILHESRRQTFDDIHVELPDRVAAACRRQGVRRLLHMSAINADAANGPSRYLRSKGAGEDRVHRWLREGLEVTSFRPSIIVGSDDHFCNQFLGLLRLSPVLPLACPYSRFAPVLADDVAAAFATALDTPTVVGRRLDLCGPKVYRFDELVRWIAAGAGLRRLVVGLPDPLARLQGAVMEWLPNPLFTRDNFQSLQVDSVCAANGFDALGIRARAIEEALGPWLAQR